MTKRRKLTGKVLLKSRDAIIIAALSACTDATTAPVTTDPATKSHCSESTVEESEIHLHEGENDSCENIKADHPIVLHEVQNPPDNTFHPPGLTTNLHGTFCVETYPEDVEVTIEGETPDSDGCIKFDHLEEVKVQATLAGYKPFFKYLPTAYGENVFRFQMIQKNTQSSICIDLKGPDTDALVTVNGNPLSQDHCFIHDSLNTEVKIQASAQGFQTHNELVNIAVVDYLSISLEKKED